MHRRQSETHRLQCRLGLGLRLRLGLGLGLGLGLLGLGLGLGLGLESWSWLEHRLVLISKSSITIHHHLLLGMTRTFWFNNLTKLQTIFRRGVWTYSDDPTPQPTTHLCVVGPDLHIWSFLCDEVSKGK